MLNGCGISYVSFLGFLGGKGWVIFSWFCSGHELCHVGALEGVKHKYVDGARCCHILNFRRTSLLDNVVDTQTLLGGLNFPAATAAQNFPHLSNYCKPLKSISECSIKILSLSVPLGILHSILIFAVVTVLTSLKALKGVPVCKKRKVTFINTKYLF